MLLSKRPEIQAPGCWPAYYARAWGCKVEDLDGNVYTDFTGDVGGASVTVHPVVSMVQGLGPAPFEARTR